MRSTAVLAAMFAATFATGCARAAEAPTNAPSAFTPATPIREVVAAPEFAPFGRLLFPADEGYWSGDTLGDLRLTWYTGIRPGLPHGFGLGLGTPAEGWLDEALAFWNEQRKEHTP